MSRYVDIDKPIIVTIYNDPYDDTKSQRITTTIAKLLDGTVDYLEEDVVRCRDCKFYTPRTQTDGWCTAQAPHGARGLAWPKVDSYCSDGERKVEENE